MRLTEHCTRRRALSGFVLAFIPSLVVAFLLQGPKPFYGDSGGYWELASTFTHNGHFSFLNFESPIRGYVLPLMIHVLRTIGEDGIGWAASSLVKLLNVTLFALIGGVLVPRLAETVCPEHPWGLWRRLALTALLLVFWSGDLSYPLSDFPGLTLGLMALVLIASSDTPAWMLLAGLTAGAAVNMRPAYLPFVPMLLVIVALNWREQRGTPHASAARRVVCVALLVVGFIGTSLPQSLIAHRHFGTWSLLPGGPADLTDEQLSSSILLRRYDTYAKPPDNVYPVFYYDVGGEHILRSQGTDVTKIGNFLEIIFEHPGFMAGMAAQHLINGLDARYSTAYVEHLDSGGKLWLRLLGFLLVFLALARVLWPTARRSLGHTRSRYALALMLCSATSLFTAVETRYMLPVYALTYILVLMPGWPSPIGRREAGALRRYRIGAILLTSFLVFIAGIWQVVSLATAYLPQ